MEPINPIPRMTDLEKKKTFTCTGCGSQDIACYCGGICMEGGAIENVTPNELETIKVDVKTFNKTITCLDIDGERFYRKADIRLETIREVEGKFLERIKPLTEIHTRVNKENNDFVKGWSGGYGQAMGNAHTVLQEILNSMKE